MFFIMLLRNSKLIKRLTFIVFVVFVLTGYAVTGYATENTTTTQHNAPVNFVDERYELLALVFRLAEQQVTGELAETLESAMAFSGDSTQYMRLLNSTFGGFSNHLIVDYILDLWQNGYYPSSNDVFSMAVHLEKIGDEFVLVENISQLKLPESLVYLLGFETWTEENVHEFVSLLNDFYRDTNFADFFEEQTSYYQELSAQLSEQIVSDFNFEWFEQFGADSGNLRIILSPSKDGLNFGVTCRTVNCSSPYSFDN